MRAALTVVVVGSAVVGCGSGGDEESGTPSETTAAVVVEDDREEELTGDVVAVHLDADGFIVGFDLLPSKSAAVVRFKIEPGRDYGFPLTHLSEHESSGHPVRVTFSSEGDLKVAAAIEDA